MSVVRIGQHFLINKNVAKKIVKHFFPVDGIIIEIGPGKGILTDFLINYRAENKIIPIELDVHLYNELSKKKIKNFHVIHSNILDIKLNHIAPGDMINLIGNIPYYISKDLIDWVMFQSEQIKKGIFMMQKEFVDKLVSPHQSTHRNAQSFLFNYLFSSQKLFDVNPGSFYPKPAVRSTVFLFNQFIYLDEEKVEIKEYYGFLKACFKNRRKTLYNNLISRIDRMQIDKIFLHSGITQRVRAEQLTGKKLLEIYKQLYPI